MPEQILQILLLDTSASYVGPLSEALKAGGLTTRIERVETLGAFRMALKSAEWDVVLSAYSGIRKAMPAIEGTIPFIVLCETHEEHEAFALTAPVIRDILPVTHLKRLPFILRRELNLNAPRTQSSESANTSDRKRSEELLGRSETRFRSVIEGFSDIIFIVDTSQVIRYANASLTRVLGYSTTDVVGKSFTELLYPDERTAIEGKLADILRSEGSTQTVEHRMHRADGLWESVETTGHTMEDPASLPMLILHSRSIAERRRVEEKLRESEAKYRLLAEYTADVIWILDTLTMRFTYVSPSVEHLCGYTPDEVLAQPMDEVVTPASLAMISSSLPSRIQAFLDGDPTATTQTHEVEQCCKDGSTVWTEVVSTLLKNNGGPVQILGVSRNISERKQAEKALRESEGRYRRTLDNMLEGFQIIGFDWHYLYVNDSAAFHGRKAKSELLGHTIMEMYPGIEATEMFATLRQCMEERTAQNIENKFTYPEGSEAWFELSIQPVPEGISVLSLDITERKLAENRIRRLNRTLAVLSDINQAIVRIRHIPTLYEKACQIAVEKGGFRIVWIGLFDEKARKVTSLACAGKAADLYAECEPVLSVNIYGRSTSARSLRAGKHVICNDIAHDPHTTRWRGDALRLGCRASAVFPLKIAGKVRGIISLYAAETDFFDDAELQLLDEMAVDVSFAMEVAGQEEQRQQAEHITKRYAQRMEILHQIDLSLIQGGSIHSMAESTLKYIRKIIPCQGASLAVFDQTLGEVFVWALNLQNPSSLDKTTRTPLHPRWLEQLGTGTSVVIDDLRLIQEPTQVQQRLIEEGLSSSLHIPLISQGRLLGSFNLVADTIGFFTPEYQEIAAEVANQLAIAVRQWNLSEELAQHTALLEQRVTERTNELQSAKERVEAILNNSPDGILLTHADLCIEQTNLTFNRLFACGTDDYLHQTLLDLVHPDDANRAKTTLQASIIENVDQHLEIRVRRRDGTVFSAELSIRYIQHDGLVCTIRDITERKRTEAALQEYAAEIEDLYNNAPVGYHSLNKDGVFIQINDTELRWLGLTRGEVVGKLKLAEILTPKGIETFRTNFGPFQQRGWVKDLEFDLVHKNGSVMTVLLTAVAIYDEEGQFLTSRSTFYDITDRKQAERALNAKLEEEREFQGYLKALHEITIELAQIDQLGEFYKRAVELGLQRLGLDRMSLFLYDAEQAVAVGTYGTDSQGKLVDERDLRFVAATDGIMGRAFEREERFYIDEDVPLTGSNLENVGYGWNAAAILWNGSRRLGWLVADNLVSHKPASKPVLDTLSLYGLTVGTLLGRTQAEAARHESEARYRMLADNITDVVIRANTRGEYEYVSPSVRAMLGYEPEELVGQIVFDYIHPVDVESARQALKAMREQGLLTVQLVVRFRHKQGYYVWLETSGRAIRSTRAGEMEGFIASSRDITERKHAEDALRASEERFRHVVEAAPDHILLYDTEGIIQMANPAAVRDSGYTQDEMIAHNVTEFLTPDSRAIFEQEIPRIFEIGSYYHEEQFVRKDGSMAVMDCSGSVIFGEDGRPQSVIVLKRDITQRKQAEESLRQALAKEKELNELKSRFVSMASHEFRTPLATILAVTETLNAYRHRMTEEQIGQRLDRIKEQVGYLKDIMEDVLLLAQMQARRVEFTPDLLDLDALCRTVLEEFQSHPDVSHQLVYLCHGDMREVSLDRKLIRQIVSNLVFNAIKYSPADRPITVHLEYLPEAAIIRVRDEGIGIPEADQNHLYEPFHRASNVGTISGTGLGLVITKESVEIHGGTISVDSQVGVGTTITVCLPIGTGEESDRGRLP